jgi:hypothetical protein
MSTPLISDGTGAVGPWRTRSAARPAKKPNATAGYLLLDLSRTVRDGRYLLLAVIAPVGFYLLFSAVFGGTSTGPDTTFGLPAPKEIMVAMATFGQCGRRCRPPRRAWPGTAKGGGRTTSPRLRCGPATSSPAGSPRG